MVFVLKRKENGSTYYYLAHNLRISGKKWKSCRKYLGKKLPAGKELERLKSGFIKEFGIQLGERLNYLESGRLEKVDYIISEFQLKIRDYPRIALEKMERDFTIKFTYNTNAIEGNTLSPVETTALLNKKIAPPGRSLREIHEITNTERVLNYLKNFRGDLSRRLACRLHKILMANIDEETAGRLRTFDVAIQGANWTPPRGRDVKKEFALLISWYKKNERRLHPIELAAITHLKFIEVHPFGDGNGRLARLITNLILMRNGYPPLNIKVKDTLEYVKVLQYAQNTQSFRELADWFLQKLGENYSGALELEK